ncbi:methyl-accepting chemotaxis protein [Lysinibacillus endophyticus]|uniref:methyl-accepting chemotaxis protein n=1 Tax=Ureibacillus endophyticus TaxID=1978490 RepID=UPI00209CC3A2|nr:methyl-accepting chemotaxis protein [Lysinibacillus endophyticus]MCP1146376.1 methyl-accepting chemotaxis protein [Lysinibacillus endophyticus]
MKSLQTKMLVIFSSIFIISTLIISYSIYESSTKLVVDSISSQAKIIAENVVSKIDVNQFEQITTEETEYYYELREELNEIRKMNGLNYLYTMKSKKNDDGSSEYYYVVDGLPLDSDDASSLGEVEQNEYEALINTFKTGETQVGELTYDKEYGANVSAYVPIRNSNGEMIGLIGADYNADHIYELMNDKKRELMIYTIVVLLVIICVIYFVVRMINRPLKRLTLEMRKVKTGDFTVHLETKRKDEIGELTNTFNDMVNNVKNMIRTIDDSSQKLTLSSEEMSMTAEHNTNMTETLTEAIQGIMYGANRQVDIISNAADTIKEMSNEILQISKNIEEVSSSSEFATKTSINGREQLEHAIKQMEQIKSTQYHSSEVIKDLGEKSNEINEIVVMITDIADQTNLLALNAAIEAARAGEYGKGFAVVSEEVRKLAEQSGDAASRIASLIQEIQMKTKDAMETMVNSNQEVDKGTIVMVNTSEVFDKINNAIHVVTEQIEEVNKTIAQLSQGSVKIVEIIHEVHEIAQQSTNKTNDFAELTEEQLALTEEVYASIEQLREMSEQLETMVGQFKYEKN